MLNLGLVQFDSREGEIEYNKQRITSFTNQYKGRQDILCFPELCISGYDFDIAKSSLDEEKFFSNLSKTHNQAIIAGILLYEDGNYYDSVCMWDEKGNLIAKYKKIHLWDTENDFFSKDDKYIVGKYKNWKIGFLICADLGFPEVSRELALQGVDLIIYPSAWHTSTQYLFKMCGAMRAAENQIYTVVLNRGCEDNRFCGATGAYAPNGILIDELDYREEGYLNVKLDKDKLDYVRNDELPWIKMREENVYKR